MTVGPIRQTGGHREVVGRQTEPEQPGSFAAALAEASQEMVASGPEETPYGTSAPHGALAPQATPVAQTTPVALGTPVAPAGLQSHSPAGTSSIASTSAPGIDPAELARLRSAGAAQGYAPGTVGYGHAVPPFEAAREARKVTPHGPVYYDPSQLQYILRTVPGAAAYYNETGYLPPGLLPPGQGPGSDASQPPPGVVYTGVGGAPQVDLGSAQGQWISQMGELVSIIEGYNWGQ